MGAPGPAQEPRGGALGQAMTLIPRPLPAGAKYSIRADAKRFELTLINGKRDGNAEFYPFDKTPTDMIVNAAEQNIETQRDGIRLYVKRSPDLTALPATLHGVFAVGYSGVRRLLAQVGARCTGGTGEGRRSGVTVERNWPRLSRWHHLEPDAMRLPGAVHQRAGAGADRGRWSRCGA